METKDVVLTDEMKKKLASFMPIQLQGEFPYVPRVYRENNLPKSIWPVFYLRGIDGVQATLLEDEMLGEASYEGMKVKTTMNAGRVKVKTCRLGLCGWKNFTDVNGNKIAAPEKDYLGAITEDSLKAIPPALMTELCNAITEQSRLTEEELRSLE